LAKILAAARKAARGMVAAAVAVAGQGEKADVGGDTTNPETAA